MPINPIVNREKKLSIRTKLNQIINTLIPASEQQDGLFTAQDKIKLNSHTHIDYALTSHTHDENYSALNHTHDIYANIDHAHFDYSSASHLHDSDYASLNHTHIDYALTSHTHDENYSALNHTHTGFASEIHTHNEYSNVNHIHIDYSLATHNHNSDYSLVTHIHSEYSNIDHTHSNYALDDHTHDTYSNIDHTHTGFAIDTHNHDINYAPLNHTHDIYSNIDHVHVDYSLVNHTHELYSIITHEHDEYASIAHDHNAQYSSLSHTHNYAPISHDHDITDILNLNSKVLYNTNKDKLTIGFAGDSIGQGIGKTSFQSSFLAWLNFTGYPIDLYWDDRLYSEGGYNFAVGGANTSTILATQLPQIQARTPDILIVNGGTNNGLSNITQVNTAVNEMKTLINGAIDAGVELVIVYPIIPKRTNDGNNTTVASVSEYNRLLSNLASSKIIILNPDSLLSNLNSKYHIPKGTDGELGGVSTDGTHLSLYGNLVQKELLAPIFNKSLRILKATNAGDSWHTTNNPSGNVLSSDGLMFETGGELNGVNGNINVAKSWKLANTGGLLVTPSIVTLSSGYKAQRLQLSGTPNATSDEIKFSIVKYNSGYFLTNNRFNFEIIVSVSDFVNLPMPEITLQVSGGSPTHPIIRIGGGFGSGITKSNFVVGNHTIYAFNTTPIIANTSNRQFELVIKIGGFPGLPISGTIDISNGGIFGYVN